MTTDVKVEQIDRDAATAWGRSWRDTVDEHPHLVKAFARHRLVERAAIAAWLRGRFCQLRKHPEDQAFARMIADAIEQGQHHDD